MANEALILLDFSDEARMLLEQQDINFYEELQQAVPSLKLDVRADPTAPAGSKDATTIILALASLVSSLTPLLIRLMNQFTPANRAQQWEVDEQESRSTDGTVIIHRRYIRSQAEARPWIGSPYPPSSSTTRSETLASQPQQQPDHQP